MQPQKANQLLVSAEVTEALASAIVSFRVSCVRAFGGAQHFCRGPLGHAGLSAALQNRCCGKRVHERH